MVVLVAMKYTHSTQFHYSTGCSKSTTHLKIRPQNWHASDLSPTPPQTGKRASLTYCLNGPRRLLEQTHRSVYMSLTCAGTTGVTYMYTSGAIGSLVIVGSLTPCWQVWYCMIGLSLFHVGSVSHSSSFHNLFTPLIDRHPTTEPVMFCIASTN